MKDGNGILKRIPMLTAGLIALAIAIALVLAFSLMTTQAADTGLQSPASQVTEPPSLPEPQVASPGLSSECEAYDLHLVLDSSGSIGVGPLATMKTNIVTMVNQVETALPDTNWRAVTFRDPADATPIITTNASGWVTDPTNVITLINGMISSGFTPTAHAINSAVSGGLNSPQQDLMFIITDGDGNVFFPGGNALPADYFQGSTDATEEADAARTAGWNTVVVVFGPGDANAPPAPFSADAQRGLAGIDVSGIPGDIVLVADVADLGQALTDLALSNCETPTPTPPPTTAPPTTAPPTTAPPTTAPPTTAPPTTAPPTTAPPTTAPPTTAPPTTAPPTTAPPTTATPTPTPTPVPPTPTPVLPTATPVPSTATPEPTALAETATPEPTVQAETATPEPTVQAETATPAVLPDTGGAVGPGDSSVGLLFVLGASVLAIGLALYAYGRRTGIRQEL